MKEEYEYKVCPKCKSIMSAVTEISGRLLYKCRNFDCGILILFDKDTDKELQRWNRNDPEGIGWRSKS